MQFFIGNRPLDVLFMVHHVAYNKKKRNGGTAMGYYTNPAAVFLGEDSDYSYPSPERELL